MPLTSARERKMAEQGIAGLCGAQLARCTGPGSRTVVHLTDERFRYRCLDSGTSTWACRDRVVHLHGLQGQCYINGPWCIELHGPAVTASDSGALICSDSIVHVCQWERA